MGRQADADVDAAKADKHSDWSWELAYQHRDPRFGDMVMVQATVSLPLFASTRQDPVIAARTETAERVRIEREAARRDLVATLDAGLADHAMHHDRLHRAIETLVPLAKRRASGAGQLLQPERPACPTCCRPSLPWPRPASTLSTAKPTWPVTGPGSS